jgi:DNA-binding response OmpR family regulator
VSGVSEILIVEDSHTQAELLKYILEHAGYRVTAACDGPQALAAARASQPALVISDIEMPTMDGYALCRALRNDAQLRDVPVILLTPLADPQDVFRGLEAGADCYLTKPYVADRMLPCIEFILASVNRAGGETAEQPLEVLFEGQRHRIASGRRQLLNLLLSTFDIAVQRNQELLREQLESMRLNQKLAEHSRPV